MKNISNILILIISLLFIVTGIMIIPMASTAQNLAFVAYNFRIIRYYQIHCP